MSDHIISLDYDKNNFSIKGKGNIFLQDKEDLVNYKFKRKKDVSNFNVNLIVDKNPIIIDDLSYKKKFRFKS